MTKWTVPVVAALAVAIAIPTFAGASGGTKKHHCSFNLNALIARTKVISGSPPASGSEQQAGTVDGKQCGKKYHGALRDVTSYPKAGTLHSKQISFAPLGSAKSTDDGTGTVNEDGSVDFSGTGKITGGTGAYKGATGSYTFTGHADSVNSTVASFHAKGHLNY